MIWHWPQITLAALAGVGLVATALLDGKPRTGNNSFALSLCRLVVVALILWQGGFWAGAGP